MTLLGSNSEVWDKAPFFCPSLYHSSHFFLFYSFCWNSTPSIFLFPVRTPPLFFFPHYSPFISSPLHRHFSFHFTFILPKQLLICPLVPHTPLHCPLSPCLSIAPLFPSCPFCNSSLFLCCPPPPLLLGEVLSSRLLKRSLLLSQGRDQPQSISHMTEYAVCQWCIYMLLVVALLMASIGERVMSREPCVCMQSVRVNDGQQNWIWISIHSAKYTHWNSTHTFRNILNGKERFRNFTLPSDWAETSDRAGCCRYAHLLHAGKEGKVSKES